MGLDYYTMTRLTDRLAQFNLEYLFKFDSASLVLPPSETIGTSFGNPAFWSYIGDTNGAINTNLVGPMPGQGSYRFISDATRAGRIRHGSTTIQSTWGDKIRDQDFTMGFWVRVNQFPTVDTNICNTLNATNTTPAIPASYLGYRVGHVQSGGVNSFVIDTGGVTTTITNDHWSQPLLIERWYFIAIRKFKPNATTVSTEIYLNGVLKNSFNYNYVDAFMSFINWGQNTINAGTNYHIGCWFLATSANVPANALPSLFAYGATIQAPIKYYNGSAWQFALNAQVYYGNARHDVWASKFDGTNWIPI